MGMDDKGENLIHLFPRWMVETLQLTTRRRIAQAQTLGCIARFLR